GFAIVLRHSPLGNDEAFLFQLEKRRVEGPILDSQLIATNLLDAASDAVSVKFPHGLKCFENHERQGALEKLLVVAHCVSYLQQIGVYRSFYWLAIGIIRFLAGGRNGERHAHGGATVGERYQWDNRPISVYANNCKSPDLVGVRGVLYYSSAGL